jgi:hypothetical protein
MAVGALRAARALLAPCVLITACGLLAACAAQEGTSAERGRVLATSESLKSPGADSTSSDIGRPHVEFFDDFPWASAREMEQAGWTLRTTPGWPGVPGAEWGGNVTPGIVDPDNRNNYFVRMTASTDGVTTRQAQFCHERKYYEGTYAARVHWRDEPVAGPDGDQVVETFYLISPLKAPLDADYSEIDFEYLANGGWGSPERTLFVTTWETFRPEPEWLQVNTSRPVERISREGWHTLVVHVANQQVSYFIDDEPLATHGEPYYPEVPMSINFNLWFIKDQLTDSREPRTWQQEVDWVYHAANVVIPPAEVRAIVADLRKARVLFLNQVPARDPPLNSPCDF